VRPPRVASTFRSFDVNLHDLCADAARIKRVGEFAQRGTIRKERFVSAGRRGDRYPVLRIYKDLPVLFDR